MNRLGRYELLEKLGEGGMGAVWLGRLTGEGGFEKLCILKTVLPSIASDAQFVSRFLHEGRVLTQLQHANIAQVFDMGREGDTLYLALEYVPGVDLARLHQHLRDAGQMFPVPAALYLVQQMAEGLGFAHRKRAADGSPLHIVHRDVSPQNVMVSYDGEVKVIDFGIAKSQARSHATASASVMGKLGYMAPEQARGEPVDARADQYAAAVVLWEALANESFIPRGTMTEMVVAMASPKARPLSPLRSDVPASLEAVILKALSSSPDARYATTDDFASALMNELIRLSGLPTKLQVGEWVRATCPKEFTANQALLTRVSTTKPTEVPMDRTFVRTPTVAPVPGPSTADVAALAVPRSKLPVAALVIGGVLVLGAALAWFGLRSEAPSRGTPPPPVAQPVVPSPPPPALIAAPRVAEVFTDTGATFVRAGRTDGLSVGASLQVVGAPGADGRRPLWGEATVLEVFDDMARVSPDTRVAAAPGPTFASIPEHAPAPAPNVGLGDTPTIDAGAPAPKAIDAAAQNAGARAISVSARRTGGTPWSIIVTSRMPTALTGCTVSLASPALAARMARLPAQSSLELPASAFTTTSERPSDLPLRGGVVACDQGRAVVRW